MNSYWIRGLGVIYSEDIEVAKRHLTERQWVALELWLSGKKHWQIAQEMGITRPTATQLIARALGRVKSYLILPSVR